jgi:HTH-type transcriptional regulator / antitoxin MqsA
MKCPVCGSAELVHDTRDIRYLYKRETTLIPEVTGVCGLNANQRLSQNH